MEIKEKHKLDKRTEVHLVVMLFLSYCYYFFYIKKIFPEPFNNVYELGRVGLLLPIFMVLASMFIAGVPYIFYAM